MLGCAALLYVIAFLLLITFFLAHSHVASQCPMRARSASGIKSCRFDNLFDNYGFCQAEALLIKLVYTSHQVYYTCARGSKLGRSHRQGARSAIQATGLCYAWLTTALHRARLLSVFAPIVAKIDNIVRRAHPPVILNRPSASKSFE